MTNRASSGRTRRSGRRVRVLLGPVLLLSGVTFAQERPGLIDLPTFESPQQVPLVERPVRPANFVDKIVEEQERFEAMPDARLEAAANRGDRLAQVARGVDYAQESQALANIPALADSAAEDAVFWFDLAARRGVPGVPSLDGSGGVKLYPIRQSKTPR